MKKLILLLALAFMMCGCITGETNTYKVGSTTYFVIEIDGCEYLVNSHQFSHKGNCKFCVERRKKEQEELSLKIKEQ